MAMTPDFEETLRKIDEDLDFNPATVDAAPTPLKKIVSFEKPPARDCKSTTKVAQVAKPNGKAHITEPISLPKTTENAKAIKKIKVRAVPKPKEQGTWVRYTRVTKATNQVPETHLVEENRNPSHASNPRPSKPRMSPKMKFSIKSQHWRLMFSPAGRHKRHQLELPWPGEATGSPGAHQFGEETLPSVRVLDGDQSKR